MSSFENFLQKITATTFIDFTGADNEFYSLDELYEIFVEEYNFDKDYVEYYDIIPGICRRTKLCLTENEFLLNRNPHQHDFYELMYVAYGCTNQVIDNKPYTYHAGQCCLLNHNVKHIEQPRQNCILVFLMLSDKFLMHLIQDDIYTNKTRNTRNATNSILKFIQNDITTKKYYQKQYWDFNCLIPLTLITSEMNALFSSIIEETLEDKVGSSLIVQGYLLRVFLNLATNYENRSVIIDTSKREYLFIQMRTIMEGHWGNISRKELEEKMGYSANYLNTITKKVTGKSLLEYSRIIRMRNAATLLIQTDKSISDIARDVGYTNISHFYRLFEAQYDSTPSYYRLLHK